MLGVGNVSYGLPKSTRAAVTSLFLEAAVREGLDAAIMDTAGIPAPESIDPDLKSAAAIALGLGGHGSDSRAAPRRVPRPGPPPRLHQATPLRPCSPGQPIRERPDQEVRPSQRSTSNLRIPPIPLLPSPPPSPAAIQPGRRLREDDSPRPKAQIDSLPSSPPRWPNREDSGMKAFSPCPSSSDQPRRPSAPWPPSRRARRATPRAASSWRPSRAISMI